MSNFTEWVRGVFTRSDVPQHDPSRALSIPSRSNVAGSVTASDALGLGAVFRAVSLIAISVKQLTYDAYRGGVVLDPITAPTWLKRPDINSTRTAFLEQSAVSMALTGNAFWKIDRNDRGVSNIEVLNPIDVLINIDSAGRANRYSYQGKDYRPDQIQQLRLLSVPGTPYGRGPIQQAQAELRGAIDTQAFAGNWFTGSGMPVSGYIASDQNLNAEIVKQVRDSWTDATANRNGIPVLGSGAKLVPLYLSPEDAQWIEARRFDVTSIARMFGVPASLLLASVEGSSLTYSNISQVWVEFARFTLTQYLIEIETALSELLPRGTDVRFNLEGLLRPDTQTRYTSYQSALSAGWLLRSEVRAIEGLPAIAGIDDAPKPTPEVAA